MVKEVGKYSSSGLLLFVRELRNRSAPLDINTLQPCVNSSPCSRKIRRRLTLSGQYQNWTRRWQTWHLGASITMLIVMYALQGLGVAHRVVPMLENAGSTAPPLSAIHTGYFRRASLLRSPYQHCFVVCRF